MNSKRSIPCPPKSSGGCGSSLLELKCLFKEKFVSDLLEKVNSVVNNRILPELGGSKCSCFTESGDLNSEVSRISADRKNSDDNNIYCPTARDVQDEHLDHFQEHWLKGQPVIVRDVLALSSGLSWEPMVMWRALREMRDKMDPDQLSVMAVECLTLCEVNILTHTDEIKLKVKRITAIEKKKNSLSKKQVPKAKTKVPRNHEFRSGRSPKQPVLDVASDEQEGKSEPSGQTHCRRRNLNPSNASGKKKMATSKRNKVGEIPISLEPKDDKALLVEGNQTEGGALWDIFRRQDVSKLHQYLMQHAKEFRDCNYELVKQVTHPIHDQCFYLTNEHKRKLKEEYGIEPWTFEQKLGEAVFIPAGCPHQVRNLKSCVKVALDFVSPENLQECIRLTEEFRLLPKGHRVNQDKLEVKKIALHAPNKAIEDITVYNCKERPKDDAEDEPSSSKLEKWSTRNDISHGM